MGNWARDKSHSFRNQLCCALSFIHRHMRGCGAALRGESGAQKRTEGYFQWHYSVELEFGCVKYRFPIQSPGFNPRHPHNFIYLAFLSKWVSLSAADCSSESLGIMGNCDDRVQTHYKQAMGGPWLQWAGSRSSSLDPVQEPQECLVAQ